MDLKGGGKRGRGWGLAARQSPQRPPSLCVPAPPTKEGTLGDKSLPLEGEGRGVACGAAQWRGRSLYLEGGLGRGTVWPLAVGTPWEQRPRISCGLGCAWRECICRVLRRLPVEGVGMTTGHRGSVRERGVLSRGRPHCWPERAGCRAGEGAEQASLQTVRPSPAQGRVWEALRPPPTPRSLAATVESQGPWGLDLGWRWEELGQAQGWGGWESGNARCRGRCPLPPARLSQWEALGPQRGSGRGLGVCP